MMKTQLTMMIYQQQIMKLMVTTEMEEETREEGKSC